MVSDLLLEKSNKILDDIPANPDGIKEFDPVTIAFLILGIVNLIYTCIKDHKKPDIDPDPVKGTEIANKPGFGHRLMAKRYVKNYLGREKFRKYGREVIDSIFKLGADATEQEIKQLMEEAQNAKGLIKTF